MDEDNNRWLSVLIFTMTDVLFLKNGNTQTNHQGNLSVSAKLVEFEIARKSIFSETKFIVLV